MKPKEPLGKLLKMPLSLYILVTGHAATGCHRQTETITTFALSSLEKWLRHNYEQIGVQ